MSESASFKAIQDQLPSMLAIDPQSITLKQVQGRPIPLRESMHWLALENWLYHAEATVNQATKLADVKALIEASHHSRALQRWDIANQLCCWPVGTEQKPLYAQLQKWGHHRIIIEVYEPLMSQLAQNDVLICLGVLGEAYQYIGDVLAAQTCYERQLTLARESGDGVCELLALRGLSDLLCDGCMYKPGIALLKEQLQLAQDQHNLDIQVKTLVQLGRIYGQNLSKLRLGKDYFEQAVALAEKHQRSDLKTYTLCYQARFYFYSAQYEPALKFYQNEWQSMPPNILNSSEKGYTLRLFGIVHMMLGQIDIGMKLMMKSLDFARRTELVIIEILVLEDLGIFIGHYQNDYVQAGNYVKQAIKLSDRHSYAFYSAHCRTNLALLYAEQGNLDQAQYYLQEADKIFSSFREYNAIQPFEQALILACKAKCQWIGGHKVQGLMTIAQSLIIQPPWRSANGQVVLRGLINTVVTQPLKQLRARWIRLFHSENSLPSG